MKIVDIDSDFYLTEDALYEMSNFSYKVTGLPTNLELWVRTESLEFGHDKYRVKIKKDREWAAIYSVSQDPVSVKDISRNKLTTSEDRAVSNFISQVSSLLVMIIDGKLTTDEFIEEVKKARGSL